MLSTCTDNVDQEVPIVPVNISLDVNTELASLGIGSTMVCPKSGGYMGIIIYRHSLSEYYAFERTCSYYPNDTSAVEVNNGEIIVSCPKCGSKFVLTPDGALVNQGPAKLPLVQYRTYLSGSNRLFISN
ncbi:MAG TPA: hypothetical protein VHO90_09040 [Bacteroidales bacterium]|nr:hypothetical protein [Bacteroidales bacterium]